MRTGDRRVFNRKSGNQKSGGILFGLLLSALVVVCLVVAGGVFIARNVHVEETSRHGRDYVSIDTPAGHLSVRAHDNPEVAAAGVPIYPGARTNGDKGGGAVFQWDSSSGKSNGGFAVAASEMITPDPASEVVSYYRSRLPNWLIVNERNGSVRLEFHDGRYKRIIGIHERHDGTHIGVASIGEPASN
jgi:hypothetical protein